MASTELTERQKDELQAIQAIFDNTCKVQMCQNGFEVSLTLLPQACSADKDEPMPISIDLVLKCGSTYPNSTPSINLQNAKGLRSESINKLKQQLEALCKANINNEMMLELAQHVQSFLYKVKESGTVLLPRLESTMSFYEGMVECQKQQEQTDEETKLRKELREQEMKELERCAIQEEIRRRRANKRTNVREKVNQNTSILDARIFAEEKLKGPVLVHGDAASNVDINFSRLLRDFTVIGVLGKGGFGSVMKVRNNLDLREYAIKQIGVNSKSQEQVRKMTREVKLLSRLNHERVVRYYNAWTEEVTEVSSPVQQTDMGETSSETTTQIETVSATRSSALTLSNSDGIADVDEPNVFGESVRMSSEDSDCSDGSGSSIVFERSEGSETDILNQGFKEETSAPIDTCVIVEEPRKIKRYLYIQMEYCEKNTIRELIQSDLYKDMEQVWRLFREIVDGLHYIHSQGLIHRDLKPKNLFLDSNDHVKIGDFGLAVATDRDQMDRTGDDTSNTSNISFMGGHTKGVGTFLYMAPEIMNYRPSVVGGPIIPLSVSGGPARRYNQKVDIYSLGIILFEMCTKPLSTFMERSKVIGALRSPECVFPIDFDKKARSQEAYLIMWMMDLDPSSRPSTTDLLRSDRIPLPRMEAGELSEVLRHTLSNKFSESYRQLMLTMFEQPMSQTDDFAYDMSASSKPTNKTACGVANVPVPKLPFGSQRNTKHFQECVKKLQAIFEVQGAVPCSTPLLYPSCSIYNGTEDVALFMDQSGNIVQLPYDLRVPFARHVARQLASSDSEAAVLDVPFRRYRVARVFRERPREGCHPKEVTECAYDVVSREDDGLLGEAELIYTLHRILAAFSVDARILLHLNHSMLLDAILLHVGVEPDKQADVVTVLRDFRNGKLGKLQAQIKLCGMIGERSMKDLFPFVEWENDVKKTEGFMRIITKRNKEDEATTMARRGLLELNRVIRHMGVFGCNIKHVVCLGMVQTVRYFSGVYFQLTATSVRKKYRCMEVLAQGGRYDQLLRSFMPPAPGPEVDQTKGLRAVGMSLALDRLVASHFRTRPPATETSTSSGGGAIASVHNGQVGDLHVAATVLVCTCTHGHIPRVVSIVKDLWAEYIPALYLPNIQQTLDFAKSIAQNKNIPHLLIVKEESKLKLIDSKTGKDRPFDPVKDMFAYLATASSQLSHSAHSSAGGSSSSLSLSAVNSGNASGGSGGVHHHHGISASHGGGGGGSGDASDDEAAPSVVVHFVQGGGEGGDKLTTNHMRRYEAEISQHLSDLLSTLKGHSEVHVVACELPAHAIKLLWSQIDVDTRNASEFSASVDEIVSRNQNKSLRNYMKLVCDEIRDVKFKKQAKLIVVYNYKDHTYRIFA